MSSKSDLLNRVSHSWRQLGCALEGLSDAEFAMSRDDGWSIKDHLAHISAWEESLLALLDGRDRNAAIGLPPTSDNSVSPHDVDAINAAIQARSRVRLASEIVAEFHETHARVVGALARLTDDDLARSYSNYQPNDLPFNENPVIGWIVGNTYDHYDEHAASITKTTA